ncbi:MAG: hypothetical protein P8X57_15210, partial [Cyclobacteriaceae bacterium]
AVLPFAASSLFGCNAAQDQPESGEISEETPLKLNILLLGGTSFLGPHQIAYAMERGHSITTFTRGRTQPTVHKELFDNITQLTGDRANDLTALENGSWDVVIDNSGHNVDWARDSARLLKDRCDLYMFTSSTGVYYPYLDDQINEDHEVLLVEPDEIQDEEMKLEYWYGVMKSNSEIAVKEEFGDDRTLIIRPTYMIGPADKSNRFIHWPVRLSRGGDVLVPGLPADPIQYADVRDVAEFMIRMVEKKMAGTYNAAGPETKQGMLDFVTEAHRPFDNEVSLISVDDYEFLKKEGILYIVPWIMPEGNNYGSARIDNSTGIAAGLTFRRLEDTVRDTYEWWYSDALTAEQRDEFEMNPESVLVREDEILERWKKYRS